jgi:hypothetical protein
MSDVSLLGRHCHFNSVLLLIPLFPSLSLSLSSSALLFFSLTSSLPVSPLLLFFFFFMMNLKLYNQTSANYTLVKTGFKVPEGNYNQEACKPASNLEHKAQQ